jgi:NADH dehydrogenase (ubiquinone) 1 alpha subcomplex subunit 6
MYSLGMPPSALRTKIRTQFEKHRYVNQLGVVDTLLFQSHAEYQVWSLFFFEMRDWWVEFRVDVEKISRAVRMWE